MDSDEVQRLYERLLDAWNRRDAEAYASLFSDDATVIGFDGSLMRGRAAIATGLSQIFKDHPTGRYVGVVKEIRPLISGCTMLRAASGLVPAGQADLNPNLNAVQVVLAVQDKIVLFQNTPAAFHGRPEAADELTAELRQALRAAPASP